MIFLSYTAKFIFYIKTICVTHGVQQTKSLNLSLCVSQLSVDEHTLVQSTDTTVVSFQCLLVTLQCHLRAVLETKKTH